MHCSCSFRTASCTGYFFLFGPVQARVKTGCELLLRPSQELLVISLAVPVAWGLVCQQSKDARCGHATGIV